MTSPQFPRRSHRARQILDADPGAWPAAERFRALRQAGELAWPDWCYDADALPATIRPVT